MTPATCHPHRTDAREVPRFSIPLWARHGRARKTLVLLYRARALQNPDVVLAIDGYHADCADRPLLWQRLWKLRIVSKLRDLDIPLRLSEDDAASQGLNNLYGRKING